MTRISRKKITSERKTTIEIKIGVATEEAVGKVDLEMISEIKAVEEVIG